MSSTDELDLTAPTTEDAYDAWRSAADEAAHALASWAASPGPMRCVAFVAYAAALDREENCALALERDRRTARLLWWLR